MEYEIETITGRVKVSGQGVRLKPKDAYVLSVRGLDGPPKSYAIDHLPTGRVIWGGYYYANVARALAKELLRHCSDCDAASITALPFLCDYLKFYSLWEVKDVATFEEWRDSDEARRYLSRKDSTLNSAQEIAFTLHQLGYSLGWVEAD